MMCPLSGGIFYYIILFPSRTIGMGMPFKTLFVRMISINLLFCGYIFKIIRVHERSVSPNYNGNEIDL